MAKKLNKQDAFDTLSQALYALGGQMPAPQQPKGINSSLDYVAKGGADGIDRDPRLETLRRNVLDQTAYTPEAKQTLQNIPLRLLLDAPKEAGAVYRPESNMIRMGQNNLDPESAQLAINMLRHEFNHALDPNTNPNGSAVSSEEFNNNFYATASQQGKKNMDTFQKYEFAIPGYEKTPKRQDIEGYAEVGSRGQNVLLSNPAIAAYFKKSYAPYTPAPRYNPVYSDKKR